MIGNEDPRLRCFLDEMVQRPGDPGPFLILCDFLEEQSDERAEFVREWLATTVIPGEPKLAAVIVRARLDRVLGLFNLQTCPPCEGRGQVWLLALNSTEARCPLCKGERIISRHLWREYLRARNRQGNQIVNTTPTNLP